MRKISTVFLLVLLLFASCGEEGIDADLLYGSWIEEANSGHPRPTVDFIAGSEYCIVDYISAPVVGTAVYKCTITGEFSISGNLVTLLTANVESIEDGTGGTGFPYEGVVVSEGIPMGSFYGGMITGSPRTGGEVTGVPDVEYEPVVWEIIRLTDSILEFKVGIETFRYSRR